MNYLVLVVGILYLIAALHSIYVEHPLWAVVWACYGCSALALFALEGANG